MKCGSREISMRRQFYGFLTCVMTRDGSMGNLTYTAIPLGLLRLP